VSTFGPDDRIGSPGDRLPDRTARPGIRHAPRLAYLDWLRGIAVLIMIEAHTVDAWTRTADRSLPSYAWATILGGMGAPLFLFLAGISVSLAADSRLRRVGCASLAARSVRRRGWEILGLAFVFRLQSYLLNPGASAAGLLKVDILNIMGPSIVAAAWLWQLGRTPVRRAMLLSLTTAAVALLTPIVRAAHVLDPLPDVVEAYVRPSAGLSTFTFFPWSGFVLAGTVAGLLIARARDGRMDRAAIACTVSGMSLALAGYVASFGPSPYRTSSFWTSSPSFFCLRLGLMAMSVGVAYWWTARPWRITPWAPIRVLGVSSLFVYWIHVEIVYGVLGTPLKRALPLPLTLVACAAFAGLMLLVVWVKARIVTWWRNQVRPRWPGARDRQTRALRAEASN
jgi:uncharacterized membrane protein